VSTGEEPATLGAPAIGEQERSYKYQFHLTCSSFCFQHKSYRRNSAYMPLKLFFLAGHDKVLPRFFEGKL
jgi:hypothetical protein